MQFVRALISVIFFACCGFPGLTQTPPALSKTISPQFAGTYQMSTGKFLSKAKSPQTIRTVLYNNTIRSNYYSYGGAFQEWIDEGGLRDRGSFRNEQILAIQFSYCSTYPDPTQNSGSMTISIYDETVLCGGPGGNFVNGGYVCAYDIVGVPLGNSNGQLQCWDIQVDLTGGYECPSTLSNQACHLGDLTTDDAADKLFGWSVIAHQDNTGLWIAEGGRNTENGFDWFDETGMYLGCYWFGGPPFLSFYIKLLGDMNPDGRFYRPCASNSFHELFLDHENVGGTEYLWSIHNASPAEDIYLFAAFRPDERVAPTGTALLNRDFLLFPLPTLVGQGPAATLLTDLAPLSGKQLYIQAVSVGHGSGPPNQANPPTQWSNGYCDLIR